MCKMPVDFALQNQRAFILILFGAVRQPKKNYIPPFGFLFPFFRYNITVNSCEPLLNC